LTRYVVTLPRNLGGSGVGKKDSERTRWTNFVTWAAGKASQAGRIVALDLWDETEFIRQLTLPTGSYAGIRTYWFDQVLFTAEWFQQKFESVRADLNERFSPDDHVDVSAQRHLDILCRNKAYRMETEDYCQRVRDALEGATQVSSDPGVPETSRAVALQTVSELTAFERDVTSLPWIEAPRIDLASRSDRMGALYHATAPGRRAPEDEAVHRKLRHLDRLLETAIVAPVEPGTACSPDPVVGR
jgi:hypothetical protein